MRRRLFRGTVFALFIASPALTAAEIRVLQHRAILKSANLERVLQLDAGRVTTVSFSIGGRQMLAGPAPEFSVRISQEESNRKPRGLRPEEAGEKIDSLGLYRARGRLDSFDPSRFADSRPDAPRWVNPRLITAASWSSLAGEAASAVSKPAAGVTRLTIRTLLGGDPALAGVTVELDYEVYDGHPAVRKWITLRNGGSRWLKFENLLVEDLHLVPWTRKALAAAMFGVQPSVVAFEAPGAGAGVIAASEIPSALRSISDHGAMGYTPELFEWVVGPGEAFTSEPVFYYGFSGPVQQTASSFSTPLDRAVEAPYMEFLKRQVGIAAESAPIHGPQWMTWAYFYDRIDDKLVRQLADIAARAGFTEMLLDDGWQQGRLGTDVDVGRFPDFGATSEFVRSKGLALGLWVSDYRDRNSRDLAAIPDGPVLPILIRDPALPGVAMSYASRWRDYNVRDLVEVARRYGVTYLKQDFSAILYGDLAEGHESRTRKESILRGLRGLLAAQAALRRQAPDIVNELTHEIYWGTPGVPADLAALKHTARFHIPPNECIGSDIAGEFPGRSITAAEHAEALRQGCWLARQRFYSHRGLPLYPLEFYAAATASHLGSLTPKVQDRQVASWLMGMPVCFSGDSRTLTADQISHYRKRLEAVKRLQSAYGIYRHFQFSGVPEPTDVDWHWWGKLNQDGYGAVVVLRGSGGEARRPVNIPWVRSQRTYRVSGLFSGKSYGVLQGQALQSGLLVELPTHGQELLELAPAADTPALPAP